MKYVYQEIIMETLLAKSGNIINKETLSVAEIEIGQVINGVCAFNEKDANNLHITVTYGTIFDVCDTKGSDLDIDFTVYDVSYPSGLKNHVVCYIEIK